MTRFAAFPNAASNRVALRLREWSSIQPAAAGEGRLLAGLSFESEADRASASELTRAGVVTVTELYRGLSVETGSFIGRIAIGPLDLTIVPKISWERWLTLVGYALRLRGLVSADRLNVSVESVGLQDLIILELVTEARDLLARGLDREYVRKRESLATPRGRIDFARIAKRGGIREPAIPCRFTRRLHDSPLNRALLSGLHLAAGLASDRKLRADARRLAHELESNVTSQPLSDGVLLSARTALDRRTERYGPSIRLIELLFDGQSITLGDGATVPLRGFALDMNRIWQQLLGRVLREWSDEIVVREEFALRDVFHSNHAYPLRRSVPRPRPDFAAFRKSGQLVAFLDAKYRDLWSKSLPREMLYQVALYAMAQGSGSAAMLYPTDSQQAHEQRLDIRDPISDSVRASVALRPVNLSAMEKLISAPSSGQRTDGRRSFSRSLLGE